MHAAEIALYCLHYNFCRVHKTLRVTPAMEAGIDTRAPKPKRPKTYKKQKK